MRSRAKYDMANATVIMDLQTRVRQPAELTATQRGQMLQLMSDHYDDVDASIFERDLSEKQWVITTEDSAQGIVGFTTLGLLTARINGSSLVALYSGDTAFAPTVWGSSGWVRVWGKHVTKVVKGLNRGPIPWLLLTATHRTYRFLPAFFRHYYPRPEEQTPDDISEIIGTLARLKFPNEYDAKAGVVRSSKRMRVRRDRIALATEGLDHPDAQFFVARNPGYLDGDYLACLTFISPESYTRLGRKLFLEE